MRGTTGANGRRLANLTKVKKKKEKGFSEKQAAGPEETPERRVVSGKLVSGRPKDSWRKAQTSRWEVGRRVGQVL